MQWSISQEKVIKEYRGIMDGEINLIVQTSDKNHMFVSECDGCLKEITVGKQIDVKEQIVVRDYGKIHK